MDDKTHQYKELIVVLNRQVFFEILQAADMLRKLNAKIQEWKVLMKIYLLTAVFNYVEVFVEVNKLRFQNIKQLFCMTFSYIFCGI